MNPKMNMRMSWRKAMIVGVVACTLALPTFASAEEMMAKSYDYTGIQTMMKDGMELVPLRQVAESLGFKVTWQDDTHSIVLAKMGNKGMMEDKMMDDKGKMEDKNKMDDKELMEDKSMIMGQTFIIQIDSKMITADGKEGMLMYTPILIDSMTYVPKSFVEMYLLK